jgi:hypothetical protein
LFADDTSLGHASQDEDQIKYAINHNPHELGDWSKRWLMSFNPDKTEIMLFKNVENSTNFYYILFDLHLGLHSQGKCHQQTNGLRKEAYHQYH